MTAIVFVVALAVLFLLINATSYLLTKTVFFSDCSRQQSLLSLNLAICHIAWLRTNRAEVHI